MRWPHLGLALAPVLLAGCGDDALGALNAALAVDPSTLDFGTAARGSTKTLTLTLINKGSFLLSVDGFNTAAPFVPPVDTLTINTGARVEVSVGFSPTELGRVTGSMSIRTNDPDAPDVAVPMSGTGIEAAVEVTPASIDFGEVLWKRGTVAESREVTVRNPGTDTFELTAIDLLGDGGGSFSTEADNAVRTFPPGHSEGFRVLYLPTSMGSTTGAARIHTTAPAATEVLVPLSGIGVGPELELCAAIEGQPELCTGRGEQPILDFGKVDRISRTSATVRVINAGTRAMELSEVMLTGAGADFHFSPELSTLARTSLAPSAQQPIEIEYVPSDYLFDSTFLGVASDSKTRPTVRVRLSGEVHRPDIDALPRGVSFSLEGLVTRSTADVGLVNCGDAPLTLTADVELVQTRGPVPAFSVLTAPRSGDTLPPESCTNPSPSVWITVAFETTTAGVYAGELRIASDDPMEQLLTVELEATKR
ncbi:MAG: choice-of-anchor D domain-containing protein [Deltaproteobacteria bacterium]|nr:choice-of-anchor D domain-containing protein [Deltaproteobacteria bacterium]